MFRAQLGLTATKTALLVAVPVLLGSLGRIPVGMLADRYGGRVVLSVLMAAVALPVALVPTARSFPVLLAIAFLLGLAGSSFSAGVGYVSRWTPVERQGTALGVYGVGTGGQSLAVFGGPLLAVVIGWPNVFRAVAAGLFAWAFVFWILARDAPGARQARSIREMTAVLRDRPLCWALGAFYFLTFGGFVAFAVYLPTLLRDSFGLSPTDAGFRAAGFVVLATFMRPVGGWLSDWIGGARVLSGVLIGVVPFALLLAWPVMLPFSVGALGCAALLGLGNGAVFKLVPQYFPTETGTVTGLVGAMGGLGGFFPPLLLGVFRDELGTTWPAFVLLALISLLLWGLNNRTFMVREQSIQLTWPPEWTRTADRLRAGAWATLVTAILVAAIIVGSRNLQNFDAALVIYTFAVVFATWGVAYHYRVWLSKPPTRLYWRRSPELLLRRGVLHSFGRLVSLTATHLLGQTFIRKRSSLRWAMHQLIFWGCLLATAITFPLVFGWIHFGTAPDAPERYVTYLFGFPVASFALNTVLSWAIFHGLDIAAILVLAGIALSLWRRMRERGAQAMQSFSRDFFPLVVLFAISVTGLALTVSTTWLRGAGYGFLAILHAVTVVVGLLYLPFGKFFHIFQRPAQLGVKLYQEVGAQDPGADCVRCGERFASRMHVEDLKQVLGELGFDYKMQKSDRHWQDVCPTCKRKSLAVSQLMLKESMHG